MKKKEVYKNILKRLIKTNSISNAIRGVVCDKTGRKIINNLWLSGFIEFQYEQNRKVPELTIKGYDLYSKLNDFSFEFKEKEVLG